MTASESHYHSRFVGEPKPLLGMKLSNMDVAAAARYIASDESRGRGRARVLATPNIQHIALMRTDPPFRMAMELADLVTCDGFPVYYYARLMGRPVPSRVTGREIVEELMNRCDLNQSHRLFFLVDSRETGRAVLAWSRNVAATTYVEIAPLKFGERWDYCQQLSERIRDFRANILLLGVGAPRSELFASRFGDRFGQCWALCIGQSVKIALGLTPPPPRIVERVNIEWLWRIGLEPKRLLSRYATGIAGFSIAVIRDITRSIRLMAEP